MRKSETIGAIACALAKAQALIKPAQKNAVNPHLRNRYADMEAVVEACREALSTAQIGVVQEPGKLTETSTLVVVTLLTHPSGEWIETECEVPVQKRDAQGVGSTITYGCRYALRSALAIPTGENDDDGEAAVGRCAQQKPSPPPPQKQQAAAPVDATVTTFFSAHAQDKINEYLRLQDWITDGQTWADLPPKKIAAIMAKQQAFIAAAGITPAPTE